MCIFSIKVWENLIKLCKPLPIDFWLVFPQHFSLSQTSTRVSTTAWKHGNFFYLLDSPVAEVICAKQVWHQSLYVIICVLCIISDNRRGVFLQSNSQCRHEWVPWVVRWQGVSEKLQRVSCEFCWNVSTCPCACMHFISYVKFCNTVKHLMDYSI